MKRLLSNKLLTLKQANYSLALMFFIVFYWVHQGWLDREAALTKQRHNAYQEQLYRQQLKAIDAVSQKLDGFAMRPLAETDGSIESVRIHGAWPMEEWLNKLDDIQRQLWLTPISIEWQRDETYPERWLGDLIWQLHRPAILKPEQNWLPLQLGTSKTEGGVLVSVLHGPRPAALLAVADHEQWLHEGAWYSAIGATVERIEDQSVTLRYVSGAETTLSINDPIEVLLTRQQGD